MYGVRFDVDGTVARIGPDGDEWSLDELQHHVGGQIELVSVMHPITDSVQGRGETLYPASVLVAVVNEEGRLDGLSFNLNASHLLGQAVVGPVVITESRLVR